MDRFGTDEQPLIGIREVVAIGAGAAALWRIRNRRKKARQEAERAQREQEREQSDGEARQAE
jgi:hypothetical protein